MKNLLFVLLFCAGLFAVDAPFTAREYMGQARANEPMFCGIAFKPGELTSLSNLALFQGSTELPAQFDRLVQFEDGSYQWVLCSFTDALSARQEKSYTVKTQAPAAAPPTAVSVTRSGSVVEINNGVLRFQIDTVNFNGIQSLYLNSTQILNGTTGGISLRDDVEGSTTYRNGTVTAARFIYLGPLRATYRVEGELYRGSSCGGIGYSYMVTVYAGSPRLHLEVSIRNAINAACGRWAKINRSFIGLPFAFAPTEVGASADIKAYQNGSAGVVVLDKWAGGLYSGSLHNMALNGNTLEVDVIRNAGSGPGYDSTGVYWFPDMCHKNSELYLEFYTGSKSAADLGNMSLMLKSRIVGRPDPAYLSSTGALSAAHFGTLEDEKACYDQWGWSYTGWKTKSFNRPDTNPQPNAAVPWEDIHYEAETDDAEGVLLQWIRTGYRGEWDIGEAWSRYYKVNYPFRSIGFADEGQYFTAAYVSQYANRTSQAVTGHPGYWTNWGISRVDVEAWTGCHFFGVGALDYYCLTGDIDALEGAIDLGETAWLFSTPTNRGDTLNSTNGGNRATGRQLLLLTRLYEVLRDSASFFRANVRAKMVIRSRNRDPRGFLYSNPALWSSWDEDLLDSTRYPDSLKQYIAANNITLNIIPSSSEAWVVKNGTETWKIKHVGGSWEQTYCQVAVDRFYRTTGDEDARDYVIGFGQYASRYVAYRCGIVPYCLDLDWPLKGASFYPHDYTNWSPAHDACVLPDGTPNHSTTNGSLGQHSGWYTVYYPSVCALAYRYTGQDYLLKKAYKFWDLGSKREYQTTYYFAPENQVGYFAYHNPPKDDGLLNTHHLFFETLHHGDTTAPQAITNLYVTRTAGNAGLIFSWTAPADNNGTCAEYQLKICKDLPMVDFRDYDFARDDSVQVPWAYAQNVKGEPAPSAAGTPEGFTLNQSFPTTETWYAAVRSRDASGNLSPMSNLVTIDNTIGIGKAAGALVPLLFSARPNPFNPAVRLSFYAGKKARKNVKISVINPLGQVVRTYKIGKVVPASGPATVVWDGTDRRGRMLGSGVYVVRLSADGLKLDRKVVMAK